jgi:repressor LexA
MPSHSEIAKLFGFRSTNASWKFVKELIAHGAASKDSRGILLPARELNAIPIMGTVRAGYPSPAEEELTDTMSLDQYLIRNKEATFGYKAIGDSMIEAGILDGDLVLVERGTDPKDFDIVLAEVDRELTLKYFRKRGKQVWLESANPKYPPFHPKEELRILAVMVGVVRKVKL